MSCYDETSALGLHIEVLDKRNLLVTPKRCNIGTLRLPSDPSWPKVPRRRLTDNINDVKSPCVVTLTGNRRKNHIEQTNTCQYPKLGMNEDHRTSIITRKLPNCINPRFKRQIIQQKLQETDKSCNIKNDGNQIKPELDISLQKTEKLEDNSQRASQNMDDDIRLCDVNKSLENIEKLKETVVDHTREQCTLEMNHTKISQCAIDEQHNIGDTSSQEQKQEADKPLLLMVDGQELHALPINVFNKDVSPSMQTQQCYSVQIPIISYQNVPLRIQNTPTQMQEDIKILYECQNNNMKCEEIVGNIRATSALDNSIMCISKESKNIRNVREHNAKNEDISRNENILHYKNEQSSDSVQNKKKITSNISLNQDVLKEILLDKNHDENFQKNGRENKNDGKDDAFSSDPNAIKKFDTLTKECNDSKSKDTLHFHSVLYDFNANLNCRNTGSCTIIGNHIADECIKRQGSSEMRLTKSSVHPCINTWRSRFGHHSCIKDKSILNESPINVMTNKMLPKNTQGLALIQASDGEFRKSKENNAKHGEPSSVQKYKTISTNLSKKAKSFFRKKSRLAIAHSDCSLILPGPRYIKDKQYEKIFLKVSRLLHRRNGTNSMNSIQMKYNAPKQNRKSRMTNLQTGNKSFKKPSSIPLKTQKLLTKNYWEYYRKLKHKAALAKTREEDKHPNELCGYFPESQMLQQCSVLSRMINNTLDRTSRNPRATNRCPLNSTANVMPNVCKKIHKASISSTKPIKKTRQKRKRRTNTWLLGLKIIASFSIVIYVAIIFLPMMYDYFFDEEYNDYENVDYIELTLEYIISSFGEAFNGIFYLLNKSFRT